MNQIVQTDELTNERKMKAKNTSKTKIKAKVNNNQKEKINKQTSDNIREKANQKTKKSKNKKNKIIERILIAILILIFLGIGALAMILYGPFHGFRDWYITTAMTTMTHQWLAYIFYDESTINEVMANNKVEEIQEDTNTDAIVVNVDEEKNKKQYANEYERAILEKEHENDTYKIIEISGKGYTGFLAAIYKPENVHTLVTSKVGISGQYLTTIAKNNNAVVAINGGVFDDPGYSSNGAKPMGLTYSKGELITSYNYRGAGGMIGFDNENKLILSTNCTEQNAKTLGIRDCVTCGPFLIVNGKASTVVGNGGWGTAPRTAIGQRQDGIVLFLVVDGRMVGRQGADMDDLIEIMQNYGAYNAANLDGGTSTAMVVNYELINDPIDSTGAHKTRFIASGFGLIENN